MSFWNNWAAEAREVVWLASIVGTLSVVGVGGAAMLAMALDRWPWLTHTVG